MKRKYEKGTKKIRREPLVYQFCGEVTPVRLALKRVTPCTILIYSNLFQLNKLILINLRDKQTLMMNRYVTHIDNRIVTLRI